MLQAFIDDSGTGQGPVLVLGGFIAPAENWAALSDEWQQYLDMKPSLGYFKMSEANALQGEFSGWLPERRDERIRLLNTVILNHASVAVMCSLQQDIHAKIFGDHKQKQWRSPYFYLIYGLMEQVAQAQSQFGIQGPIEWIFDKQIDQEKRVREAWDEFEAAMSRQVRKNIAGYPHFRPSKGPQGMVALQAADLCAWWARRRYMEQLDKSLTRLPMPRVLKDEREIPILSYVWREQELRDHLEAVKNSLSFKIEGKAQFSHGAWKL